ncbi:hypothetical protein HII31_04611 [Pseudocercospora fuligena]|uniref:Uncharacterized protein n=1 Tax=Pseudocercospora fuligena TaxID=685502 RepID=A0A8H6VPE2_9PEZI|nr:hypothetical protein HII31_04611 [Pseudocercospora fuligena]
MSSSKTPATRPTKDNMLDFSIGEEEDFMDACAARVHAYGLSEEQKINLDLTTLFDERDWESIASTLPKRTALHTRIYHRNNQNDIHELLRNMLKKMPPTPPGSGANSPKSKKRGRELEVDTNEVDGPQQKRQTTESTSPKAQKAEVTTAPTLLAATPLAEGEISSGELLTRNSASPSASVTEHLSSIPIEDPDSAVEASIGETEQQTEETEAGSDVQSEDGNGKLKAQLEFMRQQLVRSEKRRRDELEAQKKDYEQQLTDLRVAHAKTLENKAAEYATLDSLKYGSDRRVEILEQKLDQVKEDHRDQVKGLRQLRQEAQDDARVEVARMQKELDGAREFSNAQQMLITEIEEEKKKAEEVLFEAQRRSAPLKAQLTKLRERAGLDEQGKPKPKQRLALYGPVPEKSSDAPLHTQHSINHACERYFMQMSKDYFSSSEENWSKYLYKVQGLYKRHGFPVPVYYGGGEKKASEPEVTW